MMTFVRDWWRGLARRERAIVATGSTLLAAALCYVIAVEPAWKARTRLADELPRLQEQLAEVEALREEARLLRQQGVARDSAGSIRTEAERSLARAGVTAVVVSDNARSVRVTAANVQVRAWLEWVESFAREARVRVDSASLARAAAPGMVQAEAAFELPAR
jgi:general secretion pathway protein M